MNFYVSFFTNISILITCAYLFNLLYKNLFQNASDTTKNVVLILTFIFSGWLAMKVGLQLHKGPVFDLRVVPIIFATLMIRNPVHVLIIGIGIAASRYGVNGITPNALTGSINITILAFVSAGLVRLYRGKQSWSYPKKAAISLFTINIIQVMGIAIFGAVDRQQYLKNIMPYTLPLSILLGAFFIFIIYDFYKEQLLVDELRNKNLILIEQKQELLCTQKALEEKAAQILKDSKYKSEFMSNMSHELRTPLNSIILLSELIGENEAKDEYSENKQYADIINGSSQELLRIINDILDLSKIEAGKMEIDWGEISMEDITQLLYHQILPMAEKKKLSFQISIEDTAPELFVTDGLRLSQILRNLLFNAVKFTDSGSIRLEIRKDSFTDSIVFSVKDTGIGIDEENQKLVFDAFLQEDSTLKRKYEGTGLGLSISHQLARLLGGSLALNSIKGVGSEFTLRLPIQPKVE
ncbi:two-component system chemotaxis sensor kinase CheA [Paenibacillus endophyticus]|uniref:Circadian input-output histidine kinase CikA n=1 Tax=Paenibacillus endophyticus TaxID=1294268 RepID=A0A7W5GDX7_9BACL|nr:ATP-binding protein [Paenibacillus endophyticus]MBB3156310.1 two-component system chemotaxis sensor kinase CheA [Paenibacillus endophyticus]